MTMLSHEHRKTTALSGRLKRIERENQNDTLILAQRLGALRDAMRDKKLDGLFVSNLSDLFYLTDYKSEGYYAFVGLNEAWLLLPNLLFQQAKDETTGFTCLQGRFGPMLDSILNRNKFKKIGFDPVHTSYALGTALLKKQFVPAGGLVTQLRKIKDSLELDRLRKANRLAAAGAAFVHSRLKVGRREKDIAADLARFFSMKGDGIAFDLIIAAGAHSAYPHHINTEYRLRKGDAVICDIGATWLGYRSDLTRTFALGTLPSLFKRIYRLVEIAQKKGLERIRPGVSAESVDKAARDVIKKGGFGPQFVHSTGHGVGIDIHEDPRIGPGITDVLKAGMVITVEPGIYIPDRFGVRIEDTVLVTTDGHDILTTL